MDADICLELCDHPGCTEPVALQCRRCGAGCCDDHAYQWSGTGWLCGSCSEEDRRRPFVPDGWILFAGDMEQSGDGG